MKKNASTISLFIILLLGLSLLLYPSFANYWNRYMTSRSIASYTEQLAQMDADKYAEMWSEATAYNADLLNRRSEYILTDAQMEQYNSILNIGGSGIMGYIEIPSIDVSLPLYHGTGDTVLDIAVGHLEWSSLPVGGDSTHCVVSGHRGLPSARLFTDLDQLQEGELFMFHILDRTLTYRVDQIRIVEPEEPSELVIQEGKDLATLVTCTPYGVNSHRLLVRGHRVDNLEEVQAVRVSADALLIDKLVVVPFVLIPILLGMLVVLLVTTRKKS